MSVSFDSLIPGSRLKIAIDGGDMDVVVGNATGRMLDGHLGAAAVKCTLVFAHFGGGVEIDSPEVKNNLMRDASRHIERSMIGFLITENGNAFFRVNDVALI